ncbi:hypothetical protein [Aliiglaciecola sp. LCG003]|uniref:ATP-grasp domain-containing protein n=1 Tax=Aliiglaciecola sp. LCG003 TaxID=3053655 RepID=UPI00257387C9|nr:hypothetical protein [Aliiglaciecola sp. LCG003]WJG09862.1 hypothetical protein QR722_02165 [Aliiglaciecola sp. LCG003]
MSVAIILGASNDCHALHMLKACQLSGIEADLFDTAKFPDNHCISWDPYKESGSLCLETAEYSFADIRSVFWSTINQPLLGQGTHTPINQIAQNDSNSLLRTFLEDKRIRWVNSWQVFDGHKVKPRQLSIAAKSGASIPETYIGNHPERIRDFYQQFSQVLFKPVYGGAHAALVNSDLIEPERLRRVLRYAPVTLQRYISGTNIRTFVIDKHVYSAEIISEKVDFRLEAEAQHLPIKTPSHIAKLARVITERLGMAWSAIDWRRDSTGSYFFLEANPSPMFIHFERLTGYPITGDLLALLDT